MQFNQGQTVIHPHHGPATVTGLLSRTIKGKVIEYLELTVCDTGLTVSIPLTKCETVGIRAVAGSSMLADICAVLTAPTGQIENQWARRYKAQRMEAATGDPLRIAAVVRDLIRRREEKGMSLAERDLLKEASAPLLAEIALATGASEDKATVVLHSLVLEGSAEVLAHIDDLGVPAA